MTELEYCAVGDLARIRCAKEALRGVLAMPPGEPGTGIDPAKLRVAFAALADCEARLVGMIEIEPEGPVPADDPAAHVYRVPGDGEGVHVYEGRMTMSLDVGNRIAAVLPRWMTAGGEIVLGATAAERDDGPTVVTISLASSIRHDPNSQTDPDPANDTPDPE